MKTSCPAAYANCSSSRYAPSGPRSISTNKFLPLTRALKIPAPSAPHASRASRSRWMSVHTNARHAIPRASKSAGDENRRDFTSTKLKRQVDTGEMKSSRCHPPFIELSGPARNPTAEHQKCWAWLKSLATSTAAVKPAPSLALCLRHAGTSKSGSARISAGPHAAMTDDRISGVSLLEEFRGHRPDPQKHLYIARTFATVACHRTQAQWANLIRPSCRRLHAQSMERSRISTSPRRSGDSDR